VAGSVAEGQQVVQPGVPAGTPRVPAKQAATPGSVMGRSKVRTTRIVCSAVALLVAASPVTARAHLPRNVEPGESLWSIATQSGLSVAELAAANGLSPDAALVAGTTLLIPPAPTSAPTAAGDPSGTGDCVWNCSSAVHPHPTDDVVSPERVGSIAAGYGMSAPLTQSIAWNESAFSNAEVSEAAARGVMQIIPDTWNFINEQLVDEPLDPTSATGNVEAGVIYLHYLYHLTGGDGDATVASYHQGPNRQSLLPEARAYVREIRDDEAEFAGGG
jgi:N-acetylmuramoyl-L-alanine amidase